MQLIARIDLSRLAKALEAEGRHPDLVRAIQRAAAAGSTRCDLRDARASLTLIEQIQERSAGSMEAISHYQEETTITGALFTQAVILYARATTTKGDRPKLLGEAKLTPGERATHVEAMKLRDTAIAHFGRGEELADGPLVKEAVLFSLYRADSGSKKRVGAYTTRAQHKAGFAARLVALIDVRLAQLEARYQKLFDEADQILEAAVRADPSLSASLRDCEFDIDGFCPSPAAAMHLRIQLDADSAEDLDYIVKVPKP